MSSRDSHCTNLDRICCIYGNLLGKKALTKEELNSVFFINITKDLQYIHPAKISMKFYLLMNAASERNSTISLKTYEKLCPHDDHLCSTCVRIIKSNKGALGKIKNTSKNDRRALPSFLKFFE